ncbi:MAG: hypothetical protein FJX52_04975 [Alphaproteobacteria bacterium]|nr:hypothetical protein [Alphaproteobacteria bacterium]
MNRMAKIAFVAVSLGAAILAALPLQAGTEDVAFPTTYRSWASFGVRDRYDRKAVRFLYANPAAMNAQPGRPIPSGAILVLEERKAKLGADGNPERDPQGRYVATDESWSSMSRRNARAGARHIPRPSAMASRNTHRFNPMASATPAPISIPASPATSRGAARTTR